MIAFAVTEGVGPEADPARREVRATSERPALSHLLGSPHDRRSGVKGR